MARKEAFQEKIRQLGSLVGALDENGNSSPRELVQLLLEIHGTALERIMEIVFESGAPSEAILSKAAQDPIVRHLLILHSLHPDPLETRVMQALDEAATRLRKLNSEVELVDLSGGAVEVRVRISGHACGSTARTVQSIVEESIYDLAPDLESLHIRMPEDEVSPGFVSLDSLLKHPLPDHAISVPRAEACAAD